jgi:hypothetical protein
LGGRYQKVEGMRIPMTISGDVIGEVKNFKYLGSFLQIGISKINVKLCING